MGFRVRDARQGLCRGARARRRAGRGRDRADGAAPPRDPRDRRLDHLPDRPLRGDDAQRSTTSTSCTSRASIATRSARASADRSPDPQRLRRADGALGGLLRALFNFREIRYFDIKGEYTGLTSKAMTAPDGKIRIPLNEEGEGGGGPDRGIPARLQRRGHPAHRLHLRRPRSPRGTSSRRSARRS